MDGRSTTGRKTKPSLAGSTTCCVAEEGYSDTTWMLATPLAKRRYLVLSRCRSPVLFGRPICAAAGDRTSRSVALAAGGANQLHSLDHAAEGAALRQQAT